MSAERVVLAVGGGGLAVLVTLVGGDHHDRFRRGACAHGLQDVEGAHHVGLIGLVGCREGASHQGLGGQVEDDLGGGVGDRGADRWASRMSQTMLPAIPSATRAKSYRQGSVGGRRARSRRHGRPSTAATGTAKPP